MSLACYGWMNLLELQPFDKSCPLEYSATTDLIPTKLNEKLQYHELRNQQL